MKTSVAHKLADELESGKWRKAKGQLGRGERVRCCLGVLQEVAPKNLDRNDRGFGMPSDQVLRWAGMSRDEAGGLAALNDNLKGWREIIRRLRG